MEAILDFSVDLDVGLLDRVVTAFYSGKGTEQTSAQGILTRFQEHPDAWSRVALILERSQIPQTKFIALQILEKLIQTRWKILPRDQCEGIKTFIVGVLIKLSSDEDSMAREKLYINKLNLILVQILKQEWPHNWPTFIPEILGASKTNLSLCENNMVILKLLSEEIFDFSSEQMTQLKAKNLKQQMCGEFSDIFRLCTEVLEKAQKPSLIKATLETLLRFLNWIPLGYIFETNLIENLQNRFLEVPAFRNVTLKCFTEIGGLNVGPEYNDRFMALFRLAITSIRNMIPLSTNFADAYNSASDEEQELIQNLSLFLTSFLNTHLKAVENDVNLELVMIAHQYLIKISQVEEREIFKICLDYWINLVRELYDEMQDHLSKSDIPLLKITMGSGAPPSSVLLVLPLRRNTYSPILSDLRLVMIERMVRPEEVLIVENEEGEIVREFVKETDTITLYKSMRECLVYLTHLDVNDTENIMSEKLSRQVDGSEWSWSNLNKLCWAIGSISGAMNEDMEKKFLVIVIKELLGLCEMKRGKDNKAVVASNIMYIVGQYPRFLKAHWKFLKTVVNKLFEFMHELHEGVQDMACDTFIKIAQKCRRLFVMQQPGESAPFVEEIISTIESITSDLSPIQVHTFYEAVGYMIASQSNKMAQEKLVLGLMDLPNRAWENVMKQVASNMGALNNPDNIKILSNILKTNVAACSSIGTGFIAQIGKIYLDMLGLYKAVSEIISQAVTDQGPIATKTPKIRGMRTIKKEILKLIEIYVRKSDDFATIANNMVPPLFTAVLDDYQANAEPARESEVLNLIATILERLGPLLSDRIPAILNSIYECTLSMISRDFTEYPDHRAAFFRLIRSINKHCFSALIALPHPQFKLILDSIVWAFKHTIREIAETGLSICLELINNITTTESSVSNAFFQAYFLMLLQDIFFVMTDSDHKSTFRSQCLVISRMLQLVESGQISAPLFDPSTSPSTMTNSQLVKDFIINLLSNAFKHLQPAQIQGFVVGLFAFVQEFEKFLLHTRDFLIQLKEFSGSDNTEFYLFEKEAEQESKKKAEMEAALKIPGLVKPHDLPTMDEAD